MPSPLTLPVPYTTRKPPLGAPLRRPQYSVLDWVCNEGAGGALCDSGHQWNGTLHGGVTWTNEPQGPCLVFDGSTGYVSSALNYINIAGDFAYSLLVRLRVNDVTALQTPFSIGDMAFIVVSATDWRWQLDEGAFPFVSSAGPFASNTWYDIAITASSSGGTWSASIYVDGALSVSGNPGGPVAGTLQLGNQQTGVSSPERWSACRVSRVRVESRVWTPTEVRSLCVAPYQMF